MSPRPRRPFPPPVGWIPFVVALVAVTVLSAMSVRPSFENRVVGSVASGGDGGQAATGGGPAQTGVAASGPTAGAQTGTGQATAQTGGGQRSSGTGRAAGATATGPGGAQCGAGRNGGATAPGVTATEIHVASTIVTTGVGSGFLGEAANGMQAAINEVNSSGGICGRVVRLDTVNDGWVGPTGAQDIDNFINSGNVFALVGEPDSEGLDQATRNGDIDRAGIPVVGTDGLLKSQYYDPWIWPVAASTVSNMHIIAKYAYDHGARTFGIVFDTSYKFGAEGAEAFDQEVKRLTGHDVPGYDSSLQTCNQQFCGIPSNLENGGNSTGYGGYIQQFDSACGDAGGGKPCDVVVMLLEPQPMETWMRGEEQCNCTWYGKLYGGEPLFDDNFASKCGGSCAYMTVWTGYHADIAPFDSEAAVAAYAHSLKAQCPSCDPHNEFTEGAYLGTRLFLEACKRVGPTLTRDALRQMLDGMTADFGLSTPLHYGGSLPHLANVSMAAFADNAAENGSFNGWNYLATGYVRDPAPGTDLR